MPEKVALDVDICPRRFIGNEEVARQFFRILAHSPWAPEKMNLHDPINKPFDLEQMVRWCTTPAGRAINESQTVYFKGKGFWGEYCWIRGPRCFPSYVTLVPEGRRARDAREHEALTAFLEQLFLMWDGLWAGITDWGVKQRTWVRGTLDVRLPGPYWLNILCREAVAFIGRERLLSWPWHRVRELPNGGLMLWLTASPYDAALHESDDLVLSCRDHLGRDLFYPEERGERPYIPFDFSQYRVELPPAPPPAARPARRKKAQPIWGHLHPWITDDELQAEMARLAEAGRATVEKLLGRRAGWDPADVELVEELMAKEFRQPGRPGEILCLGLGAYLGEIFRRALGGRWQVDHSAAEPTVALVVAGDMPIYFVNKVWKRAVNGPEDHLPFFFSVMVQETQRRLHGEKHVP